MIVIKDRPGQLCNRIWAFAPFMNFALDHNVKLVIIGFSDYEHLFENLNKYPQIQILKESDHRQYRFYTGLIKIMSKIPESILNVVNIFFHKNSYSDLLTKKRNLIFIDSWTHIKPENELDIKRLRDLFLPKVKAEMKVAGCIAAKKTDYDIIIGAHIRRGDYKEYKNGRYYYSDMQYAALLNQIDNQFSDKRVCFLLCSNTSIEQKNFESVHSFILEDSSMIEDLYGLSLCDYILGPPSTYSMWASFIGRTPLRLISDPETRISLSDFSRIVSQNRFENGEVFSH